ncbi:MAG: NDP-sugar synthase [Candidatus Saganbacteria bacterium]|nr:NDP-sugar synthase [Candidatus Saganbacteria bacterium]
MKAFIMAAGVGTRLEPLTLAIPKPLVPICNVPVMEYNIKLLKKHGIKDLTANLHYFPEQIQHYFKDGSGFGVHINYSFEETLLGTAGGIKKMAVSAHLSDREFIVLSSDVLMDIDLKKLISFHRRKKALATIALTRVEDTSEFGVVIRDADCKITAFQEKPKREEALSNFANTGVYIFNREILKMIPNDNSFDFGKQLFPELAANNMPFYGMEQAGYWKDIGNIHNYKTANFDMLKKKKRHGSDRVLAGRNCKIDPSARFEGNVIIGDNCIIRGNSLIKDTIIWPETVVDRGVEIDESVIGSWCYIENGTVIGKDSIIASRCRIRAGSKIPASSSFLPDRVI